MSNGALCGAPCRRFAKLAKRAQTSHLQNSHKFLLRNINRDAASSLPKPNFFWRDVMWQSSKACGVRKTRDQA